MKISLRNIMLFVAMGCACAMSGCGEDNGNDTPDEPVPEVPAEPGQQPTTTFAKGADVSWVTEMEANGVKFYDSNGNGKECMQLMKDLGMNSIRLRVWVNPENKWNGKQDVLDKARRASALGMRLMIDFHYSDTWADPANQTKPKAWEGHSVDQVAKDVAEHTTDVLRTLKDNGIDVEWVQVGNETSWGMLWPEGQINNDDFTVFTRYELAGYNAVKAVYPDAKVIVHLNNGYDLNLFTWFFDGLKAAGGKWDIIGMSLYPEEDDWQTTTDQCLSNIKTLAARYDTDVMICEIGMPWDSPNAAAATSKMVKGCQAIDRCPGIFYWEPECYGGWNGYTKGAFDSNGRPTAALDAFK